jgi:hypothetical protein
MTALENTAGLCERLDHQHIPYELAIVRRDALMVSVAVPGERWEIEFFDDGHIEVEKFLSQGVSENPGAVRDLLELFTD